MPEMHFDVCWPDGQTDTCYSPSSVIKEYLDENKPYVLKDFLSIVDTALTEASERVRAKYGYACSSAMDQLSRIRTKSKRFAQDDSVLVKRIH